MKDPNAVATLPQLADSFFAAHDVVRGRVLQALATMQLEGYRGHADVQWFWPSALKIGASVRATVIAVETGAALPFGAIRYEISDGAKVRRVTSSAADA